MFRALLSPFNVLGISNLRFLILSTSAVVSNLESYLTAIVFQLEINNANNSSHTELPLLAQLAELFI